MPRMRQVQTGVWMWQAAHPAWKAGDDWPEIITSYAIDTGPRLVIFDPIATPDEILEFAEGRDAAIIVTCRWHLRDAAALARKLVVPLYVPLPDAEHPTPAEGVVYEAGRRLPFGVQAMRGMEDFDMALWVESRGALVVGDSLIDRGSGLEVPSEWVEEGDRAKILAALRPLTELPIKIVLPTHGEPVGLDELAGALA
jgi:glyoxylase-like metal-dependent hydrolase (beta-lactamase superfamily II)